MNIDLVYLWVDGNDPEWLEKKQKFLPKKINTIGRYQDNDELMYSLRSVEKHLPWINKIYIVTDNQIPSFIDPNHPKISIVDHTEIIPKEFLPTFNSVIIEYFLYKIPGLSEYFLYANDDTFINADVSPDTFFTKEGLPIVRLQRRFMGKWRNYISKRLKLYTNVYRKTIHKSALLVEKRFNKYYSGIPHHNVDSYLKSSFKNVIEQDFKNEISATLKNQVRKESDIQRIIHSYYALATKKGKLHYVNRSESCRIRLHKKSYMKFITRYNPVFFCLNDSHHATDDDRKRVKPFLEILFSEKSSFEK